MCSSGMLNNRTFFIVAYRLVFVGCSLLINGNLFAPSAADDFDPMIPGYFEYGHYGSVSDHSVS